MQLVDVGLFHESCTVLDMAVALEGGFGALEADIVGMEIVGMEVVGMEVVGMGAVGMEIVGVKIVHYTEAGLGGGNFRTDCTLALAAGRSQGCNPPHVAFQNPAYCNEVS